jgi:hypothetical protein
MRPRPLSSLLGILLVALSTAAGCTPDERTSQGVAEVFVDKQYVQIDPAAAETVCVGLALEKMKHIRKLTEGLAVDAGTKKPTVRYSIIEAKEEPDHGSYVFEGTIYVEGDDAFSRRWIVSTRKEGNVWRVSNFNEDYD